VSTVAAVVVSHGHAAEVARLVPALAPQVDELVVVANIPRSAPAELPDDVRVVENTRPLSFAANANVGAAHTSADYVLVANPDVVPEANAVEELQRFADGRPSCGIAGPQTLYPDGRWQPTRRSFPRVGGTLVRRTPLRRVFPPERWQTKHYRLDEQPREPVEADYLLGAFLLLRRTMLDELGGWDAGFRLYGEDIDLAYRAAKAGWERWYVPSAIVRHDYAAVIDRTFRSRHILWHLRSVLRFVRKHPASLVGR
jgi:N-acetylglucosaminyl-diphospho-decaprenol L-rhamnosyltransferase